ncbi:swr1 complex component [Mortierella sp. AD094]|nr:swr1 complex component [Mortierella sp. AD094]
MSQPSESNRFALPPAVAATSETGSDASDYLHSSPATPKLGVVSSPNLSHQSDHSSSSPDPLVLNANSSSMLMESDQTTSLSNGSSLSSRSSGSGSGGDGGGDGGNNSGSSSSGSDTGGNSVSVSQTTTSISHVTQSSTMSTTVFLKEGSEQQSSPQDLSTDAPEDSNSTHQSYYTNGHASRVAALSSDASVVSDNPPKRGPGRPPRSQTSTAAPAERPIDLNRPRRTLRAVTNSSSINTSTTTTASATRLQEIPGKGNQPVITSSATSDLTGLARPVGQRSSTRNIRPPGKFIESASLPGPGRVNNTKATPSNQRPLISQQQQQQLQQVSEQFRKRGPGRPVSNPSAHQHRNGPSSKVTPPSPPPMIPLKRGPGRPPRNPLSPKTMPHVVTSAPTPRTKSKSASPTMLRTSNQSSSNATRPNSAVSTPKSTSSTGSEPSSATKRRPGRPPRNLDANSLSASASPTSPSWKHSSQIQVIVPGSRSRKRHNKSEAEEEEDSSAAYDYNEEFGFTPRKRRVMSLNQNTLPSQVQNTVRGRSSVPEPARPSKPLTPLDKARQAKITEWEGKLHEIIDHHDSLARELYHLETYTTTLTYDPVKIKSDHSERMLRFLRNFDLWSQVPDLVSNVQLNTDRISTRRSAIEQREQLVDMLQKNVEVALPRRGDGSDMIRLGSHRGYLSQFESLEDYLNSFVYVDEEEVTPEESDARAESHAQLLDRIDALKAEGRLGGKPPKAFVDPEVPKLQYNWLMEHVMTSSRLIKEEGKLQMARARKVSKMITRHFEQLNGKSEREQRLEEKRIRKVAKLTANEVKKKWRYVEGIVKARHKALLREEQEEAGKRHLNLILEHSTQILEVQQSTLIVNTPGTPGTPQGPTSDLAVLSDVLSDRPSTPSITELPSRRSSVALSVVSSEAELDAGDAEFTAAEPDADDETTLANEESGTEDDDEEISGLAAEMDIPIEELLKQYGYQLSGDEDGESDDEDEDGDQDRIMEEPSVDEERQQVSSRRAQKEAAKSETEQEPAVKLEVSAETGPTSDLKDVLLDESMDMEVDTTSEIGKASGSGTKELDELPSAFPSPKQSDEERALSSKEIANALPESLKSTSKPTSVLERGHYTKRRRLSLTGLYRGPPLPWNPYGEVDDERTMEQEEQGVQSDPEEITDLMQEKDMSIEELLDKYAYEAESSEYSDSYYDSDSEYESSIMSSQQRVRQADPRFVVTLQDVVASRKFPTRPSSEFTDTDTEYDDNRTISIYGSDDELCLGDMLPLLDPVIPPKSPEVETFTTGANVKTKIPFLLRHQLREYQHVGMDWLASLYSNGLNGILADEMGLGKTMQTIALLAHLACEHGVWGPHLIVVPTSVMLNWEMEFKKWCPGFKIMTYYGSPRERKEKRVGWSRDNSFHVCITSYQLVVQDQSVFRRKAWQYLILDEAHNIKNFRSQRWQTLLNFNSARRLLLTGTPLQNNLMELWSLLYFLMPNGVSQTMPVGFANQKEFQEWFSHPVDRMIEGNDQQDEDSKAAIARLHTVLRPYLLRRLKADVETQMPAKYEHIVYCRLSKRQRFLYDDFMSRAKTRETLASGNFLSIINCLMQLRKVCNHPDLFEVRPIVTSFAMPSAISSFEITEFLVRRKMFSEIDEARESVNLEFLGLIFTNAEERLSKMDLETYQELDVSPIIQKKAAEFSTPQSKTLTGGNHYQDIRQYASVRRHRQMQATRNRWEQMNYVNSNRCRAQLVFGSSLLDMVRAPVKDASGCADILDQASDPCQYLNYTDAIANLVIPSEVRFHRDEETIKRFAFVTPAVLVKDYSWSPIHVNPSPSNMEAVCQKATEFLHPLSSCLQVQFPDKRLLQFDCGKLQKLDSLLRELKSGGHRALIFTQMTKVLDILEIFLNIHGHRYLRLDGATKVENRQHLTDRFNSDPKILAFILSTRSGGVGINLTGADTVIFYDSDWNPSMDRQCQDRCHRIGQTRDVHIYRFVSEFTIEENMLKKANQKRMLDNVVIQEGEFTTDYFQKMDWRDMLGEEDLAKIGDLGPTQSDGGSQGVSTVQGADLEQALAAAEDENDVLAMQQAKHEMEGVDLGDFSEVGTNTAPATPQSSITAKGSGKNLKSKMSETGAGGAKVQFAVSIEGAGDEDEDYEVIEMGHVDEYMLRFMEREYGHYVGFGGLPKPVKNETLENLEMLSNADEEEEEEEEDEYDVEESDGSDSGNDNAGDSAPSDEEQGEDDDDDDDETDVTGGQARGNDEEEEEEEDVQPMEEDD